MSQSIRIDDELYNKAKAASKSQIRTISGQIEFWAKVGKAALENPDLPVDFVRDILLALDEDEDDLEPFIPEGNSD